MLCPVPTRDELPLALEAGRQGTAERRWQGCVWYNYNETFDERGRCIFWGSASNLHLFARWCVYLYEYVRASPREQLAWFPGGQTVCCYTVLSADMSKPTWRE